MKRIYLICFCVWCTDGVYDGDVCRHRHPHAESAQYGLSKLPESIGQLTRLETLCVTRQGHDKNGATENEAT